MKEAANLFFVSLFSVILVSIVSFAFILIGKGTITRLLNAPELGQYLWLLPLSVLASGFFLAFSSWLSRAKQFGQLSVATVMSSTSVQAFQLGCGLLGYTSGRAIIGAHILGQIISSVFLGMKIFRQDFKSFSRNISVKSMRQGIVRYKKFPLIDVWGALLNTISWQIPPLMLAAFFSPTIVGLYAMGNAVIRAPLNIVGGSIAKVFYQKASDAKNNGNISSITERVLSRLVAYGLFPILMLSLVGEDLFRVVFGERWAEAGVYTQILAPWMFFTFISSPLSTLFSIFERQGSALIIQISIFITRVGSLYIGSVLGNVYIALLLFSLSGVIIYGIFCIWNMMLAHVPLSVVFGILIKYFIYFLPAGVIVTIFQVIESSSIIISVSSVILVSLYFLAIFYQDDEFKRHLYNFSR